MWNIKQVACSLTISSNLPECLVELVGTYCEWVSSNWKKQTRLLFQVQDGPSSTGFLSLRAFVQSCKLETHCHFGGILDSWYWIVEDRTLLHRGIDLNWNSYLNVEAIVTFVPSWSCSLSSGNIGWIQSSFERSYSFIICHIVVSWFRSPKHSRSLMGDILYYGHATSHRSWSPNDVDQGSLRVLEPSGLSAYSQQRPQLRGAAITERLPAFDCRL